MKIVIGNMPGLIDAFIPKRHAAKLVGNTMRVVGQYRDNDGTEVFEVDAPQGFRWSIPAECVKEVIE